MRTINYQDHSIEFSDDKTALEAIESQGLNIQSRCRQGNCHACVLQCDEFDFNHQRSDSNAQANVSAPDNSIYGLDAKQVSMGLFLSCQCKGSDFSKDTNLTMRAAKVNVNSASVIEKKSLNDRVFSIKFTCNITWQAGQFINIHSPLGERSYSIASIQDEGVIELHISKKLNGKVSNYLFENAKVGSKFAISNANGDCFYHPFIYDKPLILIGTGTGLAPLVGILKQAIKNKHEQDMHLYIAQGEPEFHYYQKQLNRLAKKHDNLKLNYICRRNSLNIELDNTMRVGELEDIIKQDHLSLKPFGAFICGAPDMVRNMQIQCILSQMDRSNIRVDSFEDLPYESDIQV
ncbi:FAD-binding oxidoreductase [Marinicellulosiphila megalodicopiae]|uniref:FAD-binding oxidoreductase n=1 Tax=Marinicellulosiphila megalodicopiae TaxID=2724896 RepID=UPI003BAF314E